MADHDWDSELRGIEQDARGVISSARTVEELEAARVSVLGRKARLPLLLRGLKDIPLEERRIVGPRANELKQTFERLLDLRRGELSAALASAELAAPDATLPGTPFPRGGLHPLTGTLEEMAGLLGRLGFARAEGPLIETERHNFEKLNIPADHPARDLQDTLYLRPQAGEGLLLRTHTSPVQIRYMEAHPPPVRIFAPGRVFRNEAVDASHSAVFHQVEGLYVDRGVTMADLKGTLEQFLRGLFGPGTRTRLRPSFYPFTEPSADVEIGCTLCTEAGSGCPVCKRSGWLEVMGCGMVHPEVLRGVGVDPEAWSGYAFGIGVERIVMLRHAVPDIRLFFENDLRFLEQFS